METCPEQKKNLARCSCSYTPCGRKGICCACVVYHRQNQQIPGCFFSPVGEKTYDRSVANFIATYR